MIRIALVLLVFFVSCTNESIQSRISTADRIEVTDNETKFSHIDSSAVVVKGFRDLLAGVPEPTDCSAQGTIAFKKGDTTLGTVGFYKDASACNFLIVDDGKQKMGYHLSQNTLIYLGVYFTGLKKQYNARHH